jgi:hypothetical protein
MRRNVKRIIDNRKINTRYDMDLLEATEIVRISKGEKYDLIFNSFFYGYEMGKRATLAEMKRKTKNNLSCVL